MSPDDLRAAALEAVRRYAEVALAPEPFEPGRSTVPVAAKVVDGADLVALTDAVLDGWLTEGRFARAFAEALRRRGRAPRRGAGRLWLAGQPARRRRRLLAPARAAAAAAATRS